MKRSRSWLPVILVGQLLLFGGQAFPQMPLSYEPVTAERVAETVRALEGASTDRRLALLALLREWAVRRADSRLDPLTLSAALREATLEIAKLAEDPEPVIRLTVLTDLGRLRAPGPVARLVWQKALSGNDPSVQRAVAEGMYSYFNRGAELREPSSGAARLRLLEQFTSDAAATLDLAPMVLRGPDAVARTQVCRALSSAIEILDDRQAELASDLNPAAFASFKRNLGPIGEHLAEAVRTIATLINRETAGIQTAMLQVLGDVAELCSTRLERDSRQRLPRGRLMRADIEPEGPQAAERLRKVLRESIPSLTELMASVEVENKLAVLSSLEDLESDIPEIWPILKTATRDQNRFVRWAALRVIGKQGQAPPELLLPALRRGLHDEDLGVRNAACQSVEQLGRKAIALVPDLANLLPGDDEELQQSALRALYAMGSDAAPAVPQLIHLLKSANPKLRQAVPPLLATIGKPAAAAAIPALRTALSDADSEVRLRAAEALRRLTE